MPRADSGTNATKEDVQQVDADASLEREPKMEDIRGSGAEDNIANPTEHRAEDRETDGTKVPDAMGAGN